MLASYHFSNSVNINCNVQKPILLVVLLMKLTLLIQAMNLQYTRICIRNSFANSSVHLKISFQNLQRNSCSSSCHALYMIATKKCFPQIDFWLIKTHFTISRGKKLFVFMSINIFCLPPIEEIYKFLIPKMCTIFITRFLADICRHNFTEPSLFITRVKCEGEASF